MFTLKNLTKKYGDTLVLNAITTTIPDGLTFICGPSGSGKSTLLRILSGIDTNYEGHVQWHNLELQKLSQHEKSTLYNKNFGFVWQDYALIHNLSVKDNILIATHLSDFDDVYYKKTIKQLKLDGCLDQRVSELSGGQMQRVAIARELMKKPEVLFCDEPSSALDKNIAKDLMTLLRKLAKTMTIVIVTHDTTLINTKDKVLKINDGVLSESFTEGLVQTKVLDSSQKLSLRSSFNIALTHFKSSILKHLFSIGLLVIATCTLATSVSGTIGGSSEKAFAKLFDNYGPSLLDVSIISEFTSASGTNDDDTPGGSVSQKINGLFEKYEKDDRIEHILYNQALDDISLNLNGKKVQIERSGNSPVLSELLSGEMPAKDGYHVVVPEAFVKKSGYNNHDILGMEVEVKGGVYEWINQEPVLRPVTIKAIVSGVAKNDASYEYEGEVVTFSVDDSFFFNFNALKDIRKQANLESDAINFVMRAKTPEDLIAIKDELNKSGLVPLGQFELVESIVNLNQNTGTHSTAASITLAAIAILGTLGIFAFSSKLRKKDFAIYKSQGYSNSHLIKIVMSEVVFLVLGTSASLVILSPLVNSLTQTLFNEPLIHSSNLTSIVLSLVIITICVFLASIITPRNASINDLFSGSDVQ